jgi:serine/threonine-protein kinase RsbT
MSIAFDGELAIRSEGDIVATRHTVREIATKLGFGITDITRIVTAASELARNVYKYGGGGILRWRQLTAEARSGLELQFVDQGPGIADVSKALEVGYSTGRGLGLGLPAAKRLMDELEIQSEAGRGTCVTLRKWRAMRPSGANPY